MSPTRVFADESASIQVLGLDPKEHVEIRAELTDAVYHKWSSKASFAADEAGVVDTSKQSPLKGTYRSVSATGLIWSMKPASERTLRYQAPAFGSQLIEFNLIRRGKRIAQANLTQIWLPSEVRQIRVSGQLHGIFFLPSNVRAGMLVLGGSEGGLPLARAEWLASHGYAALALAYFRYEGLPDELQSVPLEYFAQALSWMADRPELRGKNLGVMGMSRGAELALQLGSMFPVIKTVVAYSPANVRYGSCCVGITVPYAWTLHGAPLPYVQRIGELGSPGDSIEVENTRGPILLISGTKDNIWNSTGMAQAIVTRLREKNFDYPVENIVYVGAGHLAGRPEIIPAWHARSSPLSHLGFRDPGGSAEKDAMSSLEAVPKVLSFLQEYLDAPQ